MPEPDTIAFPTLEPEQLERLAAYGERRETRDGEVLFAEGAPSDTLFVVLSGEVAIVEGSEGERTTVAVHGPGEFTGDTDLLAGRSSRVAGVVTQPGELLAFATTALREVLDHEPDIANLLLRAFLRRRDRLLETEVTGLRVIGSRFAGEAFRLREFLSRNAVPHAWVDLEENPDAERLLHRLGVPVSATPVVVDAEGDVLRNPSLGELAERLGLSVPDLDRELWDLVVVGAGPAGLAAAVYGASEGLRTVVVEALAVGGQAASTSKIENYLGFPGGISGSDLAGRAQLQAERFGARLTVPRQATALRAEGGLRRVELEGGETLTARAVILALGAEYRRLDLPDHGRLEGVGVFYGATETEAATGPTGDVVVVGGGNAAGQAAMFLSERSDSVTLLVRGDELAAGMSRYLVDRIERCPNVEVATGTRVVGLRGDECLEAVEVEGPEGRRTLPATALFTCVGVESRTEWLRGTLALDRDGFVLTGDDLPGPNRRRPALETSLRGVFAAGDTRHGAVRRVAAAVGEGAMAVQLVHRHLARR